MEQETPKRQNFCTVCECGDEAMICNAYVTERGTEVTLAIYTVGQYIPKPGFWQRLKYCWYHMRTGKKYEDQMVLDKESALRLSEWLALAARD